MQHYIDCPVGLVVAKVLMVFFNRNFSVVARSLEVGDMITPCLGKLVKPLVLSQSLSGPVGLPFHWIMRVKVESTPVPTHTLVHYNISRADG